VKTLPLITLYVAMLFDIYSHRFAWEVVRGSVPLRSLWNELSLALNSISADCLARYPQDSTQHKSISRQLNWAIRTNLVARGWTPEARLYHDGVDDSSSGWRLDFAKTIFGETAGETGMAVEVGFNHREAIAWNLLKTVLATEPSQLSGDMPTIHGVGVVIMLKASLKRVGNFDGAVGTFEDAQAYMSTLQHKLTVPILLIGLRDLSVGNPVDVVL